MVDEERLARALGAHFQEMGFRLHVCAGRACAADIARLYQQVGPTPRTKAARREMWTRILREQESALCRHDGIEDASDCPKASA